MKKVGGCVVCLSVLMFAAGIQAVTAKDTSTVLPITPPSKQNLTSETSIVVIPPRFEDAYSFKEGLAVVDKSEEPALCGLRGQCNFGYIDQTGKMVIEPKFSVARDFSQGLAAVSMFGGHDPALGVIFGSWGYIDKTGKVVIPGKFEGATSFSEGLAAVKMDGKWGYIRRSEN